MRKGNFIYLVHDILFYLFITISARKGSAARKAVAHSTTKGTAYGKLQPAQRRREMS